MKKIRAVVFDLDGTLVYFKINYISARREIINKLYEFGIPKNLISIEQRILTTIDIAENFMKKNLMPPAKIQFIKKQVDQIISRYEMEAAKETSLIPYTKVLLHSLKEQGYKLGIFTLENRKTTNFLLKKFAIKSIFDSIVTRDDTINYKPNPEHLKTVLRQLKVLSYEIIVVGDNPVDLACAKSINALAIALLNDRHTKNDLINAGADFTVENLLEINKILEKINN